MKTIILNQRKIGALQRTYKTHLSCNMTAADGIQRAENIERTLKVNKNAIR